MDNEADLWGCLSQLMLLIWFLYWVVELAFYDWVPNPQFWKRVGENAYQLSPTADAQAWKTRLLARYRGKVEGFWLRKNQVLHFLHKLSTLAAVKGGVRL
jgi:hypothetical protein